MNKTILAVVLSATVAVSGCQSTAMSREESGTFIGVLAGGILGSTIGDGRGQLLAAFTGAVLGGLVGSSIGRDLDRYDELQAQHVLEHNRTGDKAVWVNPDGGHEVSVTPTKTYTRANGQYCREYQTTVNVGGKVEQAYGTACRQPDGSWKIIN